MPPSPTPAAPALRRHAAAHRPGPRPGHIKCDILVEFAHPREYLIKTTPNFAALKARLTEEILGEALRAVEMGA